MLTSILAPATAAACQAAREVKNHEMLLSIPTVRHIVNAITQFNNVQSMSEEIEQHGKLQGGLLEITSAMSLANDEKNTKAGQSLLPHRPQFTDAFQTLYTYWRQQMEMTVNKFTQAADIAKTFIQKFEGIAAAVDSWDFSSTPYIYKKRCDPADAAMATKMEQTHFQFPNWQNQFGKALKQVGSWAEENDKKKFHAVFEELPSVAEQILTATKYIAIVLLTSSLLREYEAEASPSKVDVISENMKYVTKTLEIPMADLPTQLVEKWKAASGDVAPKAENQVVSTGTQRRIIRKRSIA